ncbi:fungal hydrophobin-domain-containing protein [Trametes gibbosa]|nr:fungal hydrophobin-domain-containing protein [Trametes gibbosa]
MLSKVVLFTTAVFTALAAATPVPQGSGSCNTGPISCCQDVRTADDHSVATLLGLLGVVVQDLTASVGLQCSPISVVGVSSGNACSATPVCCENNNIGGLISIGCVPIIL